MEAAFLFDAALKEMTDQDCPAGSRWWSNLRSERRRDPAYDPRSQAPYRCLRG